jgi:hypothetical protein
VAGGDDLDTHRLPGRSRLPTTHPGGLHDDEAELARAEAEADEEIEAVNRLMGFLRQDDEA